MLYKKYGSTDIEVSQIGFGGMRFEDQSDVDSCAALLKAAYDAGINYFDTAPGYGKSEELFGVALKEMLKTREEKPFYVSSKSWCTEPSDVRKDLETSLKRMNLDYIDFYHVWYVLSLDNYNLRKANGVLKEFEKLREEGLIRNICISSHMSGTDISEALKDYPFAGVLLGYSAMNFPYREAGIQAASDHGMAVTVMNPLGGGIIPQNPEKFNFLKTQENETVVEAALRFLLNDERITIALVGLSNQAQLREAVNAAEGCRDIPEEKIKDMRNNLSRSFDQLCTSCCYCEGKCPQQIPVAKLMDVYNCYVLSPDKETFIKKMSLYWGIDLNTDIFDRCTECGRCELACTQKLPIIKRLKELREQVDKHLKSEKGK